MSTNSLLRSPRSCAPSAAALSFLGIVFCLVALGCTALPTHNALSSWAVSTATTSPVLNVRPYWRDPHHSAHHHHWGTATTGAEEGEGGPRLEKATSPGRAPTLLLPELSLLKARWLHLAWGWRGTLACLAATSTLVTAHQLHGQQLQVLADRSTCSQGHGRRAGGLMRALYMLCAVLLGVTLSGSAPALAMHLEPPLPGPMGMASTPIVSRVCLWLVLVFIASAFHSADTAITTLWPWKVKKLASEEGESSPFQYLVNDVTRVLTTILVASTFCTVYSTIIMSSVISEVFTTSRSASIATIGLAAFSLFFQEWMPKALGVSNPELVARKMVPTLAMLATILNPIGLVFKWASKALLRLLGLEYSDSGIVTNKELRFLLDGAQDSGGVEKKEAEMIRKVLDLQGTKVSQVMTPRVDLVAIEKSKSLLDLLELATSSHYSRIPVYDTSLDNVIGVVRTQSLLSYAIINKNFQTGIAASKDAALARDVEIRGADATPSASASLASSAPVLAPGRSDADPPSRTGAFVDLSTIAVEKEMEQTYFVPETMSVFNVLNEMRKRRLHMAVVVDEYGGTSGVVTLEDLLEEIVGEIYDEVDKEDEEQINELIRLLPRHPDDQQQQYQIKGEADLNHVAEVLGLQLSEEDSDFVTISGFLCAKAGAIPRIGDLISVPPFTFHVQDCNKRRIKEVIAMGPINPSTLPTGPDDVCPEIESTA